MTTPLKTTASASSQANASYCDPKSNLRRRLPAEIKQLQLELAKLSPHFQDQLTKKFVDWVNRFEKACREKDLESILIKFIWELQSDLLVDPIEDILFDSQNEMGYIDEHALLGRDGIVYGSMSLAIWQAMASPEFRNRSPLSPEEPSDLHPIPYEPIKVILSWLRKYEPIPVSAKIKKKYEEIVKECKIPKKAPFSAGSAAASNPFTKAPTTPPHEPKATASSAGSAATDNPFTKTPPAPSHEPKAKAAADEDGADIIKRFLDAQAARKKKLDEDNAFGQKEEANWGERFEKFKSDASNLKEDIGKQGQKIFSEINKNQKEFDQKFAAVNKKVNQIEQEIVKLEKEAEEIKKKQSQLHSSIKFITHEHERLAKLIAETQQAINQKKKKKNRLKKILTIVAIVGICIFSTWALGLALEGSPIAAVVGPKSGGVILKAAAVF
jgi:hypothetical protein